MFTIHVHGDTVEVTEGVATNPDIVMHLNVETLYALSARQLSLDVALASRAVSLEGDTQAITHLMMLFNK